MTQQNLFGDAAAGPALPADSVPVAAPPRPTGTPLPVPVTEPLTAQEAAASRTVRTGLTLGDLWIMDRANGLA